MSKAIPLHNRKQRLLLLGWFSLIQIACYNTLAYFSTNNQLFPKNPLLNNLTPVIATLDALLAIEIFDDRSSKLLRYGEEKRHELTIPLNAESTPLQHPIRTIKQRFARYLGLAPYLLAFHLYVFGLTKEFTPGHYFKWSPGMIAAEPAMVVGGLFLFFDAALAATKNFAVWLHNLATPRDDEVRRLNCYPKRHKPNGAQALANTLYLSCLITSFAMATMMQFDQKWDCSWGVCKNNMGCQAYAILTMVTVPALIMECVVEARKKIHNRLENVELSLPALCGLFKSVSDYRKFDSNPSSRTVTPAPTDI